MVLVIFWRRRVYGGFIFHLYYFRSRRGKGPKGKGKSAYLERLRSGSYESLPPVGRVPTRMMSTPAEIESVPMTPNSNKQQSDLDLTTPGERRGNSASTVPL